ENRTHNYSNAQYFKSPNEMVKIFEKTPSLYLNTVEIAKRCNVTLSLDQVFLPDFPVPEGDTVETFLEKESKNGLAKRLAHLKQLCPEKFTTPDFELTYHDRLKVELDVINSMGFPGYFL